MSSHNAVTTAIVRCYFMIQFYLIVGFDYWVNRVTFNRLVDFNGRNFIDIFLEDCSTPHYVHSAYILFLLIGVSEMKTKKKMYMY